MGRSRDHRSVIAGAYRAVLRVMGEANHGTIERAHAERLLDDYFEIVEQEVEWLSLQNQQP